MVCFFFSPLVPCPNLYGQLNALQFTLDQRSILWLNQFVLDLKQSLIQFMAMYKLNDNSKSDEHVDVRVDGLMLKVCCHWVGVLWFLGRLILLLFSYKYLNGWKNASLENSAEYDFLKADILFPVLLHLCPGILVWVFWFCIEDLTWNTNKLFPCSQRTWHSRAKKKLSTKVKTWVKN